MRFKLSKKFFPGKELIVFDLDGTLTPSKFVISSKTAKLLTKLLQQKLVAIIGGGRYKQFKKQLFRKLTSKKNLKNLFLFPTNSTFFYRFGKSGWRKIYGHNLTVAEKRKIFQAFRLTFKKYKYKNPKKVYGEIIDDRGSQITFSALGQKAPTPAKEQWNKNSDVRPQLIRSLKKFIPGFEVHQAGLTSIDVTRKGIDKAYGIRHIEKILKIPIRKMLFIGDALYPGGNDYTAKKTGIDYVWISGPDDTNKVIKNLLKN